MEWLDVWVIVGNETVSELKRHVVTAMLWKRNEAFRVFPKQSFKDKLGLHSTTVLRKLYTKWPDAFLNVFESSQRRWRNDISRQVIP